MNANRQDTLPASGFAYLTALTIIWGTSWPILKIALSEIPPWTFRGLIAPTAAIFLFGLGYLMKEELTRPRGQWGPLLLASALNITGWHIFSAFGLLLVNSGHASILAYTMPLWAVLIGILFTAERPSLQRYIGLAFGIAGIAVLLGGDLGVFASSPLGTLLMLGSALSWGAGTVVQKQVDWQLPPVSLAGWQLLIGGLPMTVIALIVELPHWEPVSATAVWTMIYILVVPIVFCWFVWFKIVASAPVTVSSVSTLLIPVIGVASGSVVLGEAVGWREAAALILVCVALGCVLMPSRRS